MTGKNLVGTSNDLTEAVTQHLPGENEDHVRTATVLGKSQNKHLPNTSPMLTSQQDGLAVTCIMDPVTPNKYGNVMTRSPTDMCSTHTVRQTCAVHTQSDRHVQYTHSPTDMCSTSTVCGFNDSV
jgi:hypothetical protein